jgi:hypothetical protein
MITAMSIIHPFNKDSHYRMTEVPQKPMVTVLPECSPKRCTRLRCTAILAGGGYGPNSSGNYYLKLTGGFTQTSRCSVLATVSKHFGMQICSTFLHEW